MSFLLERNHSENHVVESETSGIEAEGQGSTPRNEGRSRSGLGLEVSTSSLIRFYPLWCSCFETIGRRHPGTSATWREVIAYFFQCPPAGPLPRIISFLVTFLLSWLILFLLIGKLATGPILSLVILEILGLFSGMGMRILGLPALLAPLTIGIIIRNVPFLDRNIFKTFGEPFVEINNCYSQLHFHNSTYNQQHVQELISCCNKNLLEATAHWINPIRQIALTLILTRAGLELSPKQLKKLKGVVPLLAFGPCIVEALTCALLFFLFFKELEPSVWFCLVAGFALSAVSPAVVVPGAVSLKKRGFGVSKGIPTLLIASSSIDDVLAITLYTIFLSIGISQSPKGTESFIKECPTSPKGGIHIDSSVGRIIATVGAIPLGVIHGILVGCFLHFIPARDSNSNSKGIQRLVLTIILNVTTMLVYERSHVLGGAGSIGVLVTSFVASFGWRSEPNWKPTFHKVEHTLGHIWTLFVPILFGTIGKEIRFVAEAKDPYKVTSKLTPHEIYLEKTYWDPFALNCIWRVLATILICLVIRALTSFLIAGRANLNMKERLFVAIAWLPKATVQAALAPIVLSAVLENAHTVQMMIIAKLIVSMAVCGIILSAPLGAIAIAITGPLLLTKGEEEDDKTTPRETGSLSFILSALEFPPRDDSMATNSKQDLVIGDSKEEFPNGSSEIKLDTIHPIDLLTAIQTSLTHPHPTHHTS